MKLKNTKLREGDEVIVISGREKGKRGFGGGHSRGGFGFRR